MVGATHMVTAKTISESAEGSEAIRGNGLGRCEEDAGLPSARPQAAYNFIRSRTTSGANVDLAATERSGNGRDELIVPMSWPGTPSRLQAFSSGPVAAR